MRLTKSDQPISPIWLEAIYLSLPERERDVDTPSCGRHDSNWQMDFDNVTDAFEVLSYGASFWRFVLDAGYRRDRMAAFQAARVLERGMMVVKAGFATTIGMGIPALIVWFVLN